MSYSLGIDIGSVAAKLAVIDDNGRAIQFDIEKAISGPRAALGLLLSRLSQKIDLSQIATAGVSGSGRTVIPEELNWAEYTSSLSIASGLLRSHPDAKTIIQIGGQSSLVIELVDGLRKPWKVASNPLCAAGTGRFVEQQAYRIGISLDDFSRLALEFQGTPPRIAARCSVFAKSDLIHLQQKGVPMAAMLYALCGSIARMVVSLKKGPFEPPVYFVGGVAANGAVARALNEVLSARNGQPVQVAVPENYLHIEAMGAALLARESGKKSRVTLLAQADTKQKYFEMPKLEQVIQQDGWKAPQISQPFTGYLGVDVGSTSTKAVIMDESGKRIMAKHYLMTAGKPVEAVKEVFRHLVEQVGDKALIAGVGVTGSGRYLVGSVIGADLIRNEITAQTRAAADVDPEADIIEIGGQDSKLVIKRNLVVVDYQMNKACAAGTGSFIDELAEMLGISVKDGQFASLAFDSPHTIDLGTRCAAFMGQAVASAQQDGVPLGVITASLARSIAGNYLSKVVGNRRLGNKVILTGAVFYNEAVVSAFKQALSDKSIIVPEHKEVSGAIGAALLAKEETARKTSSFKGFPRIIESSVSLSTFTCQKCDNNCTISRMQMPNEKPTFYGSRCDLFDSTLSHEKMATPFDEREKLLFREYREGAGSGPTVGIPRALVTYDWAPLLLGFLNALDAKVVLSSKTNKQIMEQAGELAYSDSCFPVKLLHGHAASLSNVDFILFPSAIRLGRKEGDENQKYSCPLVQASPYIIRRVLDLGDKLLIPTIDLSLGDAQTVDSFADVAVKMGFSRQQGKAAAEAGLRAQRLFEKDLVELGKQHLEKLSKKGQLGVVLFSRAYNSQDSGANLGIAEKLGQLGVTPIPLDMLPLSEVNINRFSDRPYWVYEGKHIAGAAIVAGNPWLYGLVLTNFGCGPNSFILNVVEDIMGGKPLGQLEIDEHAAEAGIVTRLEAFVDTIRGFARSSRPEKAVVEQKDIFRTVPVSMTTKKTLLIPRMGPHADVVAAAMTAFGARAISFPEPNERNLFYANRVTSGKECLPYRVTLGDFMRFFYDNGYSGETKDFEGFMPGSFGPCRFGKYALEQIHVLREIGFNILIRTTVSNNAYADLGLGTSFERFAWKGMVATDYLQKLLWRTRPYEKTPGETEKLFDHYLKAVAERAAKKESFDDVLRRATHDFKSLIDPAKPRRPLVGINGEIYLRSNRFSNNDVVKACEAAGLEAVVSPIGEWIKYISYRNVEDAVRERKLKKRIKGSIRSWVQHHDEHSVAVNFEELLDGKEPSIEQLVTLSSEYLSPKCGSEAVLSIGTGVEWLENPEFAGVVSVMPHGCMPGGIVAAMSESLSSIYGKPWINLTYDGFAENTNLVKINNFAEIIKFCSQVKEI